jgi:hypothetical protein
MGVRVATKSLVVGRMLDERRQFHRRGFSRRRFGAAHGRKVVALQHLHRVIEAHALGTHHPQDHVATFTAGALAVPDVFYRIDVETGIGVFAEGAEADQFLSLPLCRNWMPRASANLCTETSRLIRSFTSGGT